MLFKLSKNSSVKNILVITLSNIGDVIATALVIDILLRDFPQAKLSLISGEKPTSLFENNPKIERIHVYDKKRRGWEQFKWILGLRAYHYDLVVDLRNSLIGFLLTPRWITSLMFKSDRHLHMKDRHINRLGLLYDYGQGNAAKLAIKPSLKDQEIVCQIFPFVEEPYIVIAPRAADLSKTWEPENFIGLCDGIAAIDNIRIVMIGSQGDISIIENIKNKSRAQIVNLAGKVNLIQTVYLIEKAQLIIAHDSGPMHIASYLNKPVVALFGPTEPEFSHPWGASPYEVICHKDICQRCAHPKGDMEHQCMKSISTDEVIGAFKKLYEKV